VALVRTDVSEEPSASFIRVTRIGELGTTLAVTSNRREAHDVTSQKMTLFIVTAVKTSNLTYINIVPEDRNYFTVGACAYCTKQNKQTNSVALSPQTNYTD
jgi:hypothetical protein